MEQIEVPKHKLSNECVKIERTRFDVLVRLLQELALRGQEAVLSRTCQDTSLGQLRAGNQLSGESNIDGPPRDRLLPQRYAVWKHNDR